MESGSRSQYSDRADCFPGVLRLQRVMAVNLLQYLKGGFARLPGKGVVYLEKRLSGYGDLSPLPRT